ncbi:MAG: hypothetical protein SF069_01070 [Phycisphaerae bacterium]|nr:hypothetical protein [Phycisphaerae bacterium]
MLIEQGAWWIGAALLLAASLLARYAFFGRRVGDTPFCRKCRYNLTGVTIDDAAARCPECGVELVTRLPLRGVRPRRMGWRIAFAATLLLAIGSLTLGITQVAGRIKPIEYLPESWLIAWVETGGATATPALAELQRREALTSVRPDTVARLIARALVVQGLPQLPPEAPALLTDLTGRLELNQLSPAQVELYRKQAVVPVRLTTRPKIVAGEPFMLQTEVEARVGTPPQFAGGILNVESRGKSLAPISEEQGSLFSFGNYGNIYLHSSAVRRPGASYCQRTYYTAPSEPGSHTLRVRQPIWIGVALGSPSAPQYVDLGAVLQTEVEVVNEVPVSRIRLTRSERADELVPRAISVGYFERPREGDSNGPPAASDLAITLFIYLSRSLPVDVHLVAFGERGGAYDRLPCYVTAIDDPYGPRGTKRFEFPLNARFDRVFLVPDPTSAYNFTLFDEIWGGMLVFENLRASQPALRVPGAQVTLYAPPRVEQAWPMERFAGATLLKKVIANDPDFIPGFDEDFYAPAPRPAAGANSQAAAP